MMQTWNIKKQNTLLVFLFFLILAEGILSLLVGKYPLTIQLLLNGDSQAMQVFLTLRLPRTCMALLGGFALGVTGRIYQMIFHNPLASPDIIGVSSGASAGAGFAILFFSSSAISVTLSAFMGGFIAVLLTLLLSSFARGKGDSSIVLAGIAVHSLAQTILMILKLTADPEKELASIEYWIMGSLNGLTLSKLPAITMICVITLTILFFLYRQIVMLTVEEDEAKMLGVPVKQMRFLILILATLVVASVISVTGLISFIGLLAPHIALIITRNNRITTLWLSGMIGSILLCTADILARSVATSELPISIFTSLLGAPFLLYLMMRKESKL